MREKDFQTKFSRWFWNQKIFGTGAYELKLTKTNRLPFNAVSEMQKIDLLQVKHRKFSHKISDSGVGSKRFDFFCLKEESAYVVIMFYKRGQKEFFIIDIDDWVHEEKISKRKSITSERADEIGLRFSLGS